MHLAKESHTYIASQIQWEHVAWHTPDDSFGAVVPRPVVLKDVELFVGEVVLDGLATRIPVAIDVNPVVFLFLEIAARGVARVLAVSALCLQAFCGIHDTCWQRGSVWRTESIKVCKTSFILCAPILSKKDNVHLSLNPSLRQMALQDVTNIHED